MPRRCTRWCECPAIPTRPGAIERILTDLTDQHSRLYWIDKWHISPLGQPKLNVRGSPATFDLPILHAHAPDLAEVLPTHRCREHAASDARDE